MCLVCEYYLAKVNLIHCLSSNLLVWLAGATSPLDFFKKGFGRTACGCEVESALASEMLLGYDKGKWIELEIQK